jgi:hypothetical protein
MKMPLVEALSALATLLSTYQVVRGPKSANEAPANTELMTPGLVLAYEFAKNATDDAARRLDGVRSRLAYLAAGSGLAVVAATAVASFGDEAVELDSLLFLVALGLACAVMGIGALVLSLGVSYQSPREAYEKHMAAPDTGMLETMLAHTQDAYDRTEAVVSTGRAAVLGLSVLFAAQLVLLVVWIPVAH